MKLQCLPIKHETLNKYHCEKFKKNLLIGIHSIQNTTNDTTEFSVNTFLCHRNMVKAATALTWEISQPHMSYIKAKWLLRVYNKMYYEAWLLWNIFQKALSFYLAILLLFKLQIVCYNCRTFCTGQSDLARMFWLISLFSQGRKLIASLMIRTIPF